MAEETAPMLGARPRTPLKRQGSVWDGPAGGRVSVASLIALEFFNTFFYTLFAAGASVSVGAITYSTVADHISIGRLLVGALCNGMSACTLLYTSFSIYNSFDTLYVRNHKRQRSRMPVGHFNPAVTLAVALLRDIPLNIAMYYFLAQFSAATLAGLVLRGTLATATEGSAGATVIAPSVDSLRAVLVEVILSSMLILIILVFYVRKEFRSQGLISLIAPIPVGGFLACATMYGMAITGASMNPARSFGPAILAGNYELQWVFWVGPAIGAFLASLLFRQYDTRSAKTELG